MLFELALNDKINDRLIGPEYRKRLLNLKNKTRHYIFDRDASHKQGRFAIRHADLVCRNAAIAIPPFPNTYIEIDNIAALEAGAPEVSTHGDAALRVGFLFTEHGEIFTITGGNTHPIIVPFIYCQHGSFNRNNLNVNLDQFGHHDDIEAIVVGDMARTWSEVRETLLVGTVGAELEDKASEFKPLLANLYDIGITRTDIPEEILRALFFECIGGLKRAIAAVLLLNERVGPTITKIPASRRFVGHKQRATPPHAVVTIDLDMPAIHKVYLGTGSHHDSPRRHEVAGHWVHYDVSTQCKHNWVPFHSDDAEKRDLDVHGFPLSRLVCSHCGGRRTKKLHFERGTGDTVVHKDYKVIASKEKERG